MGQADPTRLRCSKPHCLPVRYRGPVLQAGGVEPSDQAGGRGEGAAAARHPRPLGEAEPGQRESGTTTRRPHHVRPHHRRDRGCVHQGVWRDRVVVASELTAFLECLLLFRIYHLMKEILFVIKSTHIV